MKQCNKPVQVLIVLAHALVGWMYCGTLIGVGRQFMSMYATLIVHAIGAPFGFFLISLFYFKKFSFTNPLQTAIIFVGFAVVMDVFVVAMFIEKSFEITIRKPSYFASYKVVPLSTKKVLDRLDDMNP